MNMQAIGRKICELRKQMNMTQVELADGLGVSYQAVSSWERGLTMPDISKLPDISQVLRVSVDELLDNGKQAALIKSILTNNTEEYLRENEIDVNEIKEVAPILKPRQVDTLVSEGCNLSLDELCGIAPFVSREVLDQIAQRVSEVGDIDGLCGIAPFVSKEILNDLALRASDGGSLDELCGIAPFISKDILDQIALKAASTGDLDDLSGIAPFVSKNVINQLAVEAARRNGIEILLDMPFVDKSELGDIAKKVFQSN